MKKKSKENEIENKIQYYQLFQIKNTNKNNTNQI